MATLIGVPPSLATAFIQVDEDVGAGVSPCQGDTRILDRLEILILLGLGAGGHVMMVAASHGCRCLCSGKKASDAKVRQC